MKSPTIGVGLTFFSELEPLFKSNRLVDFLEIEPQVFWKHTQRKPDVYEVDMEALASIKSFSQPKVFHSIGSLGGTHSPDLSQISPLLMMKKELQPLWISDHLSFNTASGPNALFKTGFLLPLRQNLESVKIAAKAITSMANHLGAPLAVETGVNYLRSRDDELMDGEFVGAVADAANCGLLLDMHNIWTNQLNGRQPVDEFLHQIPLDRVWEVHMAGGFEEDGYWLDAHSGEIQKEMLDISKQVIPILPNLRAITFEIYPSFISKVGLEVIRKQLKTVRRLWELRGKKLTSKPPSTLQRCRKIKTKVDANSISPTEWENTLGALVVGQNSYGNLAKELAVDPGITLYTKLITSFRASMVVRILKLTSRLILLNMGKESFSKMLESYWLEHTPELFASDEAEGFARYLRNIHLDLPFLNEVIEFEMATLATTLHGKTHVVSFPYDPFPVLLALAQGKLPDSPASDHVELEITPDDPIVTGDSIGNISTLTNKYGLREIVWHH
ncbi:MAG: DUF692 family protein [Thaumarchaeota archaeon]|nr:DUF692 family protein [Nitrososphaerota archaeon]